MRKIIATSLLTLSSAVQAYQPSSMEQSTVSLEQNPAVEKQIKGDYPDMQRQESYPLGAIQKAWDDSQDGIYKVIYRSSEVIKFRVREFMTSTLVFPKWEKITEVIVGDPSSYSAKVIKPHVISIKSVDNIGVDSTLTMVGESGRVYNFYVRTEGYNSKNISDVGVYIKVPYSGADPARSVPLENKKEDYLEDAYFDPSKITFSFSMAGDKEIAPDRVYTDGIRTWFDFGSDIHKKTLPAIYKIEDGVDAPVNVSRDGNKIVVQASGSFSLKHGAKTVCVMSTSKDL